MLFGVEPVVLLGGGLGAATFAGGYAAYQYHTADSTGRDDSAGADASPAGEGVRVVDEYPDAEGLEVPAPDVTGHRFGTLFEMLTLWRARKKRKRLGKKGYVRWYVVGETWEPARFVKPDKKAGGLGEYELDGETYLFPERAMRPAPRYGLPTVVHQRGVSDPVNLDEPEDYAVPVDELSDYLTKRVTTDVGGFLNVTARNVVMIAMALLILAVVARRYLGL